MSFTQTLALPDLSICLLTTKFSQSHTKIKFMVHLAGHANVNKMPQHFLRHFQKKETLQGPGAKMQTKYVLEK